MAPLRVGIIGTGRKKEKPDVTGFAMAYRHAAGYQALADTCELVACADIVRENAEAFAHATGIPADGVFTDYRAMLAAAKLDVVSICTWPHLHAPMAIDCACAGVRAVHCEKPMADSWGSARLMAELPWTAFIRLIAVWTAVTVMFVFYSRHAARRHHEAKRAAAAMPTV